MTLKTRRNSHAAAGLAVLAMGAATTAQAVPAPVTQPPVFEHHDAPGLRTPEAQPLASPPQNESEDSTPLGADLAAVILVTPDDPSTIAAGAHGVQIDRIKNLPRARRLAWVLKGFLGKPLSRKLITEIQVAVVKHYRASGYPLVSVAPPPQDVTDGVLRLRVVEFRLGKKTVSGAKLSTDAYVAAQVRAKPGDRIDGRKLEEDLTWLNHSPFRQATSIFSPGAELGQTDLRIDVADTKRWQVYAGYANTGSASSGHDRYFIGGEVGDLLVRDSLLSYELTTSDDYLAGKNGRYADAEHPAYLNHSLVLSAPLAPRQDLTLTANYSQTFISPGVGIESRVRTEQVGLTYRTALSNFTPLPGDLSLGVEARGQQRDTFFGGTLVYDSPINVGQVLAGWSTSRSGQWVKQSFSAVAHVSPGNLGARNRDADFQTFTQNRISRSTYVYANFNYSADVQIGGGRRYVTSIQAQVANEALLDTEQMAIGGEGGVRAFNLDDGAYDEGVIWRNELRLRSRSLFGTLNRRLNDRVSPYFFADFASAYQMGPTPCGQIYVGAPPPNGYYEFLDCRPHQNLGGLGAGADYSMGHFSATLTGAWALDHAVEQTGNLPQVPPYPLVVNMPTVTTREGHLRLLARATLRF